MSGGTAGRTAIPSAPSRAAVSAIAGGVRNPVSGARMLSGRETTRKPRRSRKAMPGP